MCTTKGFSFKVDKQKYCNVDKFSLMIRGIKRKVLVAARSNFIRVKLSINVLKRLLG